MGSPLGMAQCPGDLARLEHRVSPELLSRQDHRPRFRKASPTFQWAPGPCSYGSLGIWTCPCQLWHIPAQWAALSSLLHCPTGHTPQPTTRRGKAPSLPLHPSEAVTAAFKPSDWVGAHHTVTGSAFIRRRFSVSLAKQKNSNTCTN